MLDVLALIAIVAFFGLGLLYTSGCEALKGRRS